MTRYRVATPTNGGLTTADKFGYPELQSIDDVGDTLRQHGFAGCTVWKYDKRRKHWGIIFDTSSPRQKRQITESQYWLNVAQNEVEQ